MDEGRADNDSLRCLSQDTVVGGLAGIDVVLIVECVIAGDADVGELLDGMFDAGQDGAPVLSGAGNGRADGDFECFTTRNGGCVQIELVVYLVQHFFHGFAACGGYVAAVMQDAVDGSGRDACHLCNILDFYFLSYHFVEFGNSAYANLS